MVSLFVRSIRISYTTMKSVTVANSLIGGMPMKKQRVTVTSESETGRNQMFHDNLTGRNMNRKQFVRSIELGRADCVSGSFFIVDILVCFLLRH